MRTPVLHWYDIHEGDTVNGISVVKVWTTGKVDLENGRAVHVRDLVQLSRDSFLAGRGLGA